MESFKLHIQVRWSDLDPNGHLRSDKLCTTLNLDGVWLNKKNRSSSARGYVFFCEDKTK
ncbi:MAG: hypothetical protein L3J57_14575 [Desulfuromusa sp.]|nr:hypothetical protein [Desulfuromusa sp.]